MEIQVAPNLRNNRQSGCIAGIMTVSASIVTYDTDLHELLSCLSSLSASGVSDLWIVDNSPSQIDVDAVIKSFPEIEIRYLHRPDNPGYGAAHNVAIREAAATGFEYHLVINSDVTFGRTVVSALVGEMDKNSQIGQISPKILSADGSCQYAQRLLPTPLDVFGRRFLPKIFMRGRNRRYMLVERDDKPANIPYHQGSFMLFRMKALEEVGGFDERFFMYPEDIDITRRIHQRYLTLYYPMAKVTHAHRASSYHSLRMLRIHCCNMVRYFNKWGWFIDSERRRVNRETLRSMNL